MGRVASSLSCQCAHALFLFWSYTSLNKCLGTNSTSQSGSHASYNKASISHSNAATQKTVHHNSKYVQGVQRDSNGKIGRSPKAKSEFKKQHPCPSTGKSSGACPGYVIDHVTPLKRGGPDAPSTMQWQTKEAAKQKDKTE